MTSVFSLNQNLFYGQPSSLNSAYVDDSYTERSEFPVEAECCSNTKFKNELFGEKFQI
jgi:hypothetical protein